jgi:hypothetical protein
MANTRTYLDYADPWARPAIRLCQQAYPSYTGRKYSVRTTDSPLNLRSSWDGGSRNFYTVINLETGRTSPTLPAQSAFDRPMEGLDAVTLPPNAAIVEHCIFQGRDLGLTLIVGPANAARYLPTQETLPDDQVTVLTYTRGYKNTYGGHTNLRYSEARRATGITQEAWTQAQKHLVASGHLRKNLSITPKGKNATPNNY